MTVPQRDIALSAIAARSGSGIRGRMVAGFFIGLCLLALPAAAFAASGVSFTESSQAGLFALAILGIIVGRRASMRKPGEDGEQD